MADIYKIIEDYNPNKKQKILFSVYDMIADILNNWRLNLISAKLFIRARKLNISVVFITLSYFAVTKDVRLDSTHYFIIKIPNKQELHRIASHYSSNIDFKDFIDLYKKCTAKPYSFLVIDETLASNNPSRFRKNLLEKTWKLIMTIIDEKIRDEILEYDINKEAEKVSALFPGKIDKYELITSEEILPPDQRRLIEEAKFTYSLLGKAFEKQAKTMEQQ